MARVRDLFLTLASGSALYSGLVPALGLGEINLHSALNQPLEAEIELYQVGDLGSDEIKVRLASAEDFNRAGVERFFFLNDLRFAPMLEGGRPRIRVSSNKPVREPYLNFIVEVVRPSGSLLREYTVLIDPPGMVYAQAAAPQAPLARIERREMPVAPPRPLPTASRGERYRVQRGDSLWSIAGRLQAAGATAGREALMADIHALNPQAFSGGDRNRLRAEVELLLPDTVAPTARSVAATVPQQVVDRAALETEQRQVDAELADVSAQNRELQSALGDLQSQLAQLQAQMAEKDNQLRQIREDLQRREAEAPPAVAAEPQRGAPSAAQEQPVPAEQGTDWTLWLIGALLILALLLGVLLLVRRRAAPEPQRPPAAPEVRPEARVIATTQPLVEPEPEDEIEDEEVLQSMPAPSAPQRLPASSADPLEGANIYIAYGRFADAANVLNKAVAQQPERLDLRLRLFEVLGELGDSSAFFEQERQLREMDANPVQIDQIRARYPGLQLPQEQMPLADAVLQLDEPEPPVPPVPAPDDFQLNLDDLSLDADWGLVSPFQPEQPARAKATQDRQLDPHFNTNLEQLPEVLEVEADEEMLDSFAELPQEQVLAENIADAFSHEPVGRYSGLEAGPAQPLDSDLEHLAGSRDHLVKLNLALAYIEQGDIGSACDILNEVISEGDEPQRERARELLAKIA